MMLLERYVAKTVLKGIGFVTLMLVGLQIFILFVNQLNVLGRGGYGIAESMHYVFLHMPYEVYLLFPMASLFGALIGLGEMANHRELIVMRAAGMSIWQITFIVLRAALLVVLFITLLGETIAPQWVRIANDHKIQALSGGKSFRTGGGMWVRYQNDFIAIALVVDERSLQGVTQFHFDQEHHLQFVRKIAKMDFEKNVWVAKGVAETKFTEHKTHAMHSESMLWDVPLNPRLFSVANAEPNEMTLHELKRYLRAQKVTHQRAYNFQLSFWARVFEPLTTTVMILLAVPFVFGSLRSLSMGARLMYGAFVGFGFSILNRFFGPLCMVYQWDPMLAAMLPTLLFLSFGAYLMYRL